MALSTFFGRLVQPLRLTLLAMIPIPSAVIVAIIAIIAIVAVVAVITILGLVALVTISPTLAPVEALAS